MGAWMPGSSGASIHRVLRVGCKAALFGGLITASPAQAEIVLEGSASALQIEMRDASVQEVLTALGVNYGLRFSSATPLDRSVSGSFKGPLPRLVARLLDRYNYIVKSANGTLEVVVLSAHDAAPAAPSARVPAASAGPAAPRPAPAAHVPRRSPQPANVPASVRQLFAQPTAPGR
jgi:hypothetical protein